MIARVLRSCLCLLILLSPLVAEDGHEQRMYPAPAHDVLQRSLVHLTDVSPTRRMIAIRYLGYRCQHCVEQLLYLNQQASGLASLGVSVVAISNDPAQRWQDLVESHAIDTTVFRYVPDPDGSIATALGARRILDDSLLDLHTTIVAVDGAVRMAVYSDNPYMDAARMIGEATHGDGATMLRTDGQYIDRYLSNTPLVTTIAGPQDGIKDPIDLDFNRTPLHWRDLWVVTAESRGYATAIIHNATTKRPTVQVQKDSRASQFMRRTMGIAMGSNGSFGTAQNGEPGDGDQNYMFMGPTLWSSDTAVFASRYQSDDKKLASHLDMLHQNPWCLGIAHDTANIYWVLDAKYPGVSRYDFRDPHEVGGTDHRDGIIRRYVETSITPAQRGRPAHVALDKVSGLLYYVDPGAAKVHRLDTRSGSVKDVLKMPPASEENLAEFTSVVDTKIETVISTGLVEPVGIEIVGNRLLVGDRATGLIHLYDVSTADVTALGTIPTDAKELLGIVVGPDQHIWFVDRALGRVCRLDLEGQNSLTPVDDVVAATGGDTIAFTYRNGSQTPVSPALKVRWVSSRNGKASTWNSIDAPSLLDGGSQVTIPVVVPSLDTLAFMTCELVEIDTAGIDGVRASTVVVPRTLRRVVVQDERVGTFDIREAVALTSRMGYVTIPSDVFNAVANELRSLKTVLWNSGTVGEISAVDEAVMLSLVDRNVDLFLIADDPLALRIEAPMPGAFFRSFGISPLGPEVADSLNGQRVFTGVLADPVTAGMGLVDCQLPRLNHHRGGKYVPNMLMRPITGGKTMLQRKGDSAAGAVRCERATFRSIVLGINAARFLDGTQRTAILDRGLAWLEEGANPDTVLTTVSETTTEHVTDGSLEIRRNAPQTATWQIRNAQALHGEHMVVELYSISGQLLSTLFDGRFTSEAHGEVDCSNLSAGCYFVIARTMNRRLHSTFIN